LRAGIVKVEFNSSPCVCVPNHSKDAYLLTPWLSNGF